jgi:hypothetical protein
MPVEQHASQQSEDASITFHPTDIKTLAEELAVTQENVA